MASSSQVGTTLRAAVLGGDQASRNLAYANAAPAPKRVPWHAGTPANRSVAVGFAAVAQSIHSSQAGRSSPGKKFLSDDPRSFRNHFFLHQVPAFDALPVAPALAVPFLFSGRRRPIGLPRLPLSPLPRRLPARWAAIALARMPRTKALLASLEQTHARTRSAHRPLSPPRPLLFLDACTIFG